eukprot:2587140-Amphidinium_carterae.1
MPTAAARTWPSVPGSLVSARTVPLAADSSSDCLLSCLTWQMLALPLKFCRGLRPQTLQFQGECMDGGLPYSTCTA